MQSFTKIATLENEFEAQLLQAILDERKIEHYLKSFYDIAYDGLFQKSHGWGIVFAPAQYESEILEMIEDIRKHARNRPKRRTTLEHKVQSFLCGKPTPGAIQTVIAELVRRGVVRFDGTKALYEFD